VVDEIKKELTDFGVSFKYDDRDNLKPGYKFNEYELKGVPIRIAIGPRDLENNVVELARRDTFEKTIVPMKDINIYIKSTLEEIQKNLFDKAYNFREDHITEVDTFDKFKSVLSTKGGFVSAHWDGTLDTEQAIKKETKATIRCIPFSDKNRQGNCVYSGKPSSQRVLFAKAY
jgi:prolyl-tRNA synthetase